MRLRALLAGPARTTVQLAEIFIEGYVISPPVRGLTTANRTKLGRRGALLGEQANRDVDAERFADEFGARPMLRFHGALNLLRHFGWE